MVSRQLAVAAASARACAIAKLDQRPVLRFWPAGLYPHHLGDPFRRPIDTIGHALQRAVTENA